MKISRMIACVIIFYTCLFAPLLADGIIIVEPPIPRPPRIHPRPAPKPEPLPIKYHRVSVEINNQVATTRIDQAFTNPYNRQLEGTYIFPLPEDAAISEFAMYTDGEKISGEILEKDKARRIYEDIVRRMKDPGLLEYIGRNMFKARVFPIPPKGEKRIELVYHQTLKYDAGMIRYVYPLDTERFSPTPLEDASVSVKIKSKFPIKNVYSPSHKIDLNLEKNLAVCGWEEKNVKPDTDFVLYYHVSEKDVGLNLLTYRKRPREDGYFMMLLSPGQVEAPPVKKDIIFVLDTSGSMRGGKITQAKEALQFCIESLNPGDRFNVIGFATAVNTLGKNLLECGKENKKEALSFVEDFQARGGTDINGAMTKALEMFPSSKRPRMLVFITDGEPTIGITSFEEIIKNISSANKARARIFVFGVGHEVNTTLLDKIAEENRGVPEYVHPDENIEAKVSSFYDKISQPVLAEVELDLGKIKTRDVYPRTLPDLFKGTQLMLVGRYKNQGSVAVKLSGFINEAKKQFIYEEKFPKREIKNDFIPRLWATRKIGYLLSEIRFKGEKKELVDEVIELSKEYGVMTPYTSFLVLEPEEDQPLRRPGERVDLRPRARRPSLQFKSEAFAPMPASAKKAVGHNAVARSQTIQQLKEVEVARKSEPEKVKHVGGKTFYLTKGMWVDATYKEEMEIKEVKCLSEEYFKLLRENPGMGKYLSIAQNLIIVFEDNCYKIVE